MLLQQVRAAYTTTTTTTLCVPYYGNWDESLTSNRINGYLHNLFRISFEVGRERERETHYHSYTLLPYVESVPNRMMNIYSTEGTSNS